MCPTEEDESRRHIPIHELQHAAVQTKGTTPMPEVTLTTYLLSFAVILPVIPFAWAMFEFRSLPRSMRPDLGTAGVGNLTSVGSRRMRLK
jgi:hypothetical protein